MDVTKKFNRILQLFFILQSKSVVTIEELERRFEISRRTIYRDLKELESTGVPLVYDSGEGYAIMEGYRIQPSRFTEHEVLSLMIAEKIMQRHETEFVKQNFESALMKVKSSFQLRQKDKSGELGDKLHVNIIASEYLPNAINMLLESTVGKLVIEISYIKSTDLHIENRTVEPVGLFYEGGFWYVLAYCHLRRDYRNFRLDRIKHINVTSEKFSREHLTIDKLRNHILKQECVKISIKADREPAHYLFWERQTFGFRSEEIYYDYVIMHFDCSIHPTSFVRWFIKFADFGEIVSPVHLQTELLEILRSALKKANEK